MEMPDYSSDIPFHQYFNHSCNPEGYAVVSRLLHYSLRSRLVSFLNYNTCRITYETCKVHSRTDHEGPYVKYRYSSILYLPSALDGVGWLTPRFGRFTPGKESRYPLYRRLGGPQGRSGRVRKSRPHQNSISGPSSP
jgi:hypothetical protein